MRALKIAALCLVSLLLGSSMFAGTALAYNPFADACSGGSGSGTSKVCKNQTQINNPLVGGGSVIENVINLVAVITGLAAVIVIIISGIRFATSSGDPNSVNQAKNTILYTVIGLVVLLMARSIIIFVINRL